MGFYSRSTTGCCGSSEVRVSCTGSTPPLSNCLRTQSISVNKLFDWVVTPATEHTKVQLPEECRRKVEEACEQGYVLDIEVQGQTLPPYSTIDAECESSCKAPCKIVKIDRTTIEVDCQAVEVAIVCLSYSVEIKVIIKKTDLCRKRTSDCCNDCECEVLCCFDACVPLVDRVVLCLPEPLDTSNIRTRVIEVDVDCAGIIVGGCLDLSLFVCKEVQVEAPVKLEVLARDSQPRGPMDVPTIEKKKCLPLVRVPQSCSAIFPIPRCECQAVACATNEDQVVSFECSTGAIFDEAGTITLNADICPAGSPLGSFIIAKFDDNGETGDYYYSGDQSFCFEAFGCENQVGVTQCGRTSTGEVVVTVTGRGTFTSAATKVKEQVEFTLAFQGRQNSRSGSYRLIFLNGVDCLADTGVVTVTGTSVNQYLSVSSCNFDTLPVVSPISDIVL